MIRFFLSQDNDSHWYLIREDHRKQWEDFLDIPSDDERSWDVPDWAIPIDGPHRITFTNVEIT